jgi:chromosome segregation ATPase
MKARCPRDEEAEMTDPHADDANLSEHLWVSCPQCHRANLRIRRAHLGRRVLCKHCGRHFRARNAQDPSAPASSTQPILPEPLFTTKSRADEKREAVLENKLQQARSELTERVAERDAAHRELGERQRVLDLIARRDEGLEQELELARVQLQRASALHDELGAVRSENDRLRAAVAQLGSQVADGARREHELWFELEETRIQLQETEAQLASVDPGTIEAKARELEELRTERDRFAASQQGWQKQLDADRVQFETAIQSLQREAETLRHQLESVATERDAARKQLEALVQERDRLAARRVDDKERQGKSLEALRHDLDLARAEAGARRDDAAAAESARADLEHRLVEVEDRLRTANETSNRLDSEARAARARLAELQHASDHRKAFAGDLEAARLCIEQLTVDFRQARIANEQLRALLNVFGLVDHLDSRPGSAALGAAPNSGL